jgi:hypothetical protein
MLNFTEASTAAPVWARGHGPKIWEGLQSAVAKGLVPENPRPVEFRRIILEQLAGLRYGPADLPSRKALDERYVVVFRSA